MFSKKSFAVLSEAEKLEIAGKKYQAFKPDIDNRFSEETIISRVDKKRELPATVVPKSRPQEILEKLDEGISAVLIDEIHFFSIEIVQVARILARKGIQVHGFGLDTDFYGQPMKTTALFMAVATKRIFLEAVCMGCKELPAQRSWLKEIPSNLAGSELVGDNEYEPLCFSCFEARIQKRELQR